MRERPAPAAGPRSPLAAFRAWFSRPHGGEGTNAASTAYLARWVAFGVLIGVVAGLGAIVFFWMLEHGTDLFLGRLVGYLPPTPAGEGNQAATVMGRPWALPLVVALGGILSGLFVFLLAPEAEGHGTDAAIGAFHHQGGRVRGRVIPIKTIASAITIGSGGSGGREGPTAQISAGVGSLIGQLLGLDARELRILVAAGIGAGIGSIFRAPLGGAVLSAEILYTHDLEVEALLPSLIASIVGYSIYGAWAGWSPIFGAQPELAFNNPLQLGYYAILGLLCGVVGVLYARTFYGTAHFFHRLPTPRWLNPALAGLLVGGLGFVIPQALGTGYGWLQLSMSDVFGLPIWILLLLPFAKILATALSIGSGGSGGIFGPGMVIGGTLGAAFWRLGHGAMLPGLPPSPAPFAIVAMMALFGGIAHAPLAVMLMVAEMTGNLSLLAPAMIAVGLATLVTGDNTIYSAQLPTRADSPAHRARFSFPLLGSLSARDAMTRSPVRLLATVPVSEAERCLSEARLLGAPVVDDHKRLIGAVAIAALEEVPEAERDATPVAAVMDPNPVSVEPGAALDSVLDLLATRQLAWVPVVDNQKLLGIVGAGDIVRTYRTALNWNVRRLKSITTGTVLLESRVSAGSPLAHRKLRDLLLPAETLVVSVQREGTTILPRGDCEILPGDLVLLLSSPRSEPKIRAYLEGNRDEVTDDVPPPSTGEGAEVGADWPAEGFGNRPG